MRIWLLDEGTPGHTVQTAGIGKILSELPGSEISWVRCELRLRGWKRWLARRAVGSVSCDRALGLAHKLYPELELPGNAPANLVVSSCGKSAYLNRLLGRAFGARCVFIGERKPFPADWYDLIITPVGEDLPNELLIPVIETGRTADEALAAMRDYWKGNFPARCWSLLIGGESRSHHFAPGDWESLADGVNALSAKYGIRWLISTSRRTGKNVEETLKQRIQSGSIAEAVWWSENPKKAVGAFLAAGERIFVTQDSLTMMSESLAVGKRTELLSPSIWDMPEDSFNGGYVSRLIASDLVGRTDIRDFAGYNPSAAANVSYDALYKDFRGKLLSWISDGKL